MTFRGVDYFCVDSLFSEEELMVRRTARRFAEERILPLIRDCYRDARFPGELVAEMAALGFLGANLEV
jgi:glutaryl-CoA dehydrogenase